MTDRPSPPGGHAADPPDHPGRPGHPDGAVVEAASAFVDGQLTTAEQARFADDARFQAVADRFGRLREPLRSVPSPDAGLRNEHLAAALATFDSLLAGEALPSYSAPDTVIASLDEARRRRARRLVPALAVAAALALVGLVIGSLASRSGTSNNVTADAARVSTENPTEQTAAKAAASSANGAFETVPPDAAGASDVRAAAIDTEMSAAGPETTQWISSRQPVVVASTADDVALLIRESQSLGADLSLDNPCAANVPGVALRGVEWNGATNLLVVRPSLADVQEWLLVDPSTCAVVTGATLTP